MKRIHVIIFLFILFSMAIGGGSFAEEEWACRLHLHDNYQGGFIEEKGEIDVPTMSSYWNDDVDSVEVSSCYQVTLYQEPSYGTSSVDPITLLPGSYPNIGGSHNFEDRTSSYKVKRIFDLTGLDKTKGNPGDRLKIYGKGFSQYLDYVTIGSHVYKQSYGDLRIKSDTEIEIDIGYTDITSDYVKVVSIYGCTLTSSEKFIICPIITSLSKTEALPGDKIIANGKGFVGVKNVKIGDENVKYVVDSLSEKITITVGNKAGKVTVITENCEVSSPEEITVPGSGYTYYDIRENEIESSDITKIEADAVKRVDKRNNVTEYCMEISHTSVLSEGYMENFGNPSPQIGKHWIKSGSSETIQIDGMVYNATRDQRSVITGYRLSYQISAAFVERIVSLSLNENQHTFYLKMDGPKKVAFIWKSQYAFQVMAMPASMGDNVTPKPGTHWCDINEDVTSTAKDGCLGVTGYIDSKGAIVNFDDDNKTSYTTTYSMKETGAVQITWQYKAHNYSETVTIGNPISFSTVPLSVIALVDKSSEPVKPISTDVSQSQITQSGEEQYYWSISDKKLFPLIGGRTFQLEWQNKSSGGCGDMKLITTITTQWPSPSHYIHVAETPPVPLDLDKNDRFAFKALKYKSSDKTQVSQELEFTASEVGKSTLLFTKVSSGVATGDLNVEPAYVRVVDTRSWNTDKTSESAEIGKELTSTAHDSRVPHNGYIFWEKARYNVNVYDRTTMYGQIFPVNRQFTSSIEDDLVVIWYDFVDNISWPYKPVQYNCVWPEKTSRRIVIASRQGSESAISCNCGSDICEDSDKTYPTWPDRNGVSKEYLDPARYKDVMIYQQPDPEKPGYNPNEEHAVAKPSFRYGTMPSPPVAAFALRDDLNITDEKTYTSDNYVLLQYYDVKEAKHCMDVFDIVQEDKACGYEFIYDMRAGDPVVAPYPLNQVIGAAPPSEISGMNGDIGRNCYWEDHKGQAWAVSGDAHLYAHFWYPLDPSFWYEKDHNGTVTSEEPGDPIPWLPSGTVASTDGFPENMTGKPKAIQVRYNTKWPNEVPVLKAGETLTFAGGEYRADHPQTPKGLPMVLGWAAGQVIFDEANPDMGKSFERYLVRLVNALEERKVKLPVDQMPEKLTPAAGPIKVKSVMGRWYFQELHAGLKTRIFYDPLTGELGIRGFINDKTLEDKDLTASPPSVYVLQPNILTETEKDTIKNLEGADDPFEKKVEELYKLSRNPSGFTDETYTYTVGLSNAQTELKSYHDKLFEKQFDDLCVSLDSLCKTCEFDQMCETIKESGSASGSPYPFPGLMKGKGLALVPNAALLNPSSNMEGGYVTLAENNDPSLGSLPVALHIIKVEKDKYRGAIKTINSDNVFDEKITLRHTADFGANPENVEFEWYYREEDGTEQPPPYIAPVGTWQMFPDDKKGPEIVLAGSSAALLTDNLFFCRYRYHLKNDDGDVLSSWSEWAGAANSRPPKAGEDASETYQAQLAEGWVKRVMNGLNPFEARIKDFFSSDSPATYTSMITQAGQRFEGAVAFNPDKDVIENVGLIELYQTVLNRASDLSINMGQAATSSGIVTALLLAASRISGFYTLLGNEAYTDALDPTIGFGTDSVEYGSLAPTIFTFMNQVPTLLDEELALLRGKDEEGARPAYNRLLWNFTKAEGEAAYALSYNLGDVNKDGFIDEADGRATFPQGHGDAWGHYLTALKGYYDLMSNPYFNWESRSEKFQIEGVVMDVDYFDERKFAETAAAKAKTGREIVNLTYRSKYVEDPDGQWQGYKDTDSSRAWGLEGWGRRAGTGALFDWAVANAILPATVSFKLKQEDMDRLKREKVPLEVINTLNSLQDKGYATEEEFMAAVRNAMGAQNALSYGDLILKIADNSGLKQVDRTTVPDIMEIASQARQIQQEYDQANTGLNPLGLATDVVPFDIDPSRMIPGASNAATQFEQIYERAMGAMENAQVIFNHANDLKNRIRQVANDTETFGEQVSDQDRDYRNRLIETFGTPYEGTIGSGKVYPAGYKGPDYFLYMYVDVNEVSEETVPPPSSEFTAFFAPMNKSFVEADGESFDDLRGAFSHFFDTDLEDVSNASDSTSTDFNELEVQFPMSTGKYSFHAPSSWGMRKSPGEIHQVLIELVKAEADLQLALNDYNGVIGDIKTAIDMLNARSDLRADEISIDDRQMASTATFRAALTGLDYFIEYADDAKVVSENMTEDIVEGLPTVNGMSNDTLATVRSTVKKTNTIINKNWSLLSIGAKATKWSLETAQELTTMALENEMKKAEYKYEVQQQLKEIENLMGNEAPKRLAVFKAKEHMRQISEKYRAVLAKGLRLMEERKAFNAKVAAKTQGKRYMDMAFRLNLNSALSKYRSMFDLASRYAYLAGKAYDYETNLSDRDPASPKPLLTDIIKQRTLGQCENGKYVVGQGGLGDILTRMNANFASLKTQMGFNNPQTETGRFSLRYEKSRITRDSSKDEDWRTELKKWRVSDLWAVPEFRKFCRPFTQESAGFQPGLVIPFESNIIFGKNFFGEKLGGGDHAYDPTNFATKVRSVGLWFEGYDNSKLSETPRAYLIPAGMDVMLVPNSTELDSREWTVVDQRIPVPLPVGGSDLNNPDWIPSLDSLNGSMTEIRKYSSFRAYHDSGYFDENQMSYDSRLIGRSVWNSRWMLIIPGGTFDYDANKGLDTFIDTVTDIKLFFQTYAISGG